MARSTRHTRLDYEDRLRRLALCLDDDQALRAARRPPDPASIDPRTLALTRLAALIAVGASVNSYGAITELAINAGATPADCVDVLESLVDVVGRTRVVDAAPRIAMALGFDLDEAL